MHTHGTAVLDRPAEATSAVSAPARARDQWLAMCESQLAAALAARNADLLPVLPALVFTPVPARCVNCHGTGYSHNDFGLCSCMADQRPAYDFARYPSGDVISVIDLGVMSPGQAEAWVPCTCGIGPVKIGPYDGPELTRVPWIPDCPDCNDTGWKFSHHVTFYPRMGLPRFITSASLVHPRSTHPARNTASW